MGAHDGSEIMADKEQTPSSIKDTVAKQVESIILSEYETGKSNNAYADEDFQAAIDSFECESTARNAEWRSNIRLPQFFSLIVTQASNDASRFFSNRDFVESYVMDGEKTAESNADERLLNRTLNQKHLHFYHKHMRLKMINYLKGECYARVWWEKKTEMVMRPQMQTVESTEMDIYKNPLIDVQSQTPAIIDKEVMVPTEEIIYDRFNFEVIDPRNIFTDNSYVYTLQDKPYFIIRSETSLDKLQDEAKQFGYFNLDKLEESKESGETETAKETTNLNAQQTIPDKTPSKNFDKLERFGKFWVIVKETDPDGYPVEVEPGLDDFGKKKKNAEFIECQITFVKNSAITVMIGFQAQRCRDYRGNPYRPVIRGLHYIHPTEDSGIGDGKPQRELQIAMDDTFNLSNDRTTLSMFPVLKMKKHGNIDNATIRIEPEHIMELENTDDVQELVIKDNVQAAALQMSFIKGMSEQAFAHSPSTMGMLPQDSSVTATAIAGADSRANIRDNYKSLTFENTFESNFYWMISQLTWQYAEEETAIKLLGDKIMSFNPDGDYYWKPVSQAIETEYSKNSKIKQLSTVIGMVAPMENPKTPVLVNHMIAKILTLQGEEMEQYANFLLDPNATTIGGNEQAAPSEGGTSNQAGLPQSEMEVGTRENFQEVRVR